MDSLSGKTLRWTFTDGPVAGMRFEHTFDADGSVTWRILDGPGQGQSKREERYGTLPLSEDVSTVSYMSAAGDTLTVVLDFSTGRMCAFASSRSDWYPLTGTFEVVQ